MSVNANKDNKKIKDKYSIVESVGSGSFGVVFQAILVEKNEVVAIKKVFQDKKYKNRELHILKQLDHPNVIKLKEYFYSQSGDDNLEVNNSTEDVYLNVVMEYIPHTLSRVIRNHFKSKQELPAFQVKLYSYQLLRSIGYIHSKGICHRDIKPQNILVDVKKHIVKLCDFGSAKKLVPSETNVAYICSRYYRAPELIFNAVNYTNSVDVWSIACVIVELVLGEPVFQGNSSVDQLVEIIKMCGTPSKKDIKAMNQDYKEYKFPLIKCFTWKKILSTYSNVDDLFVDLLNKLFVYDPNKRLNAFEALCHPYFDSLRTEGFVKEEYLVNLLFDFSYEERKLAGNLTNQIIPDWYSYK